MKGSLSFPFDPHFLSLLSPLSWYLEKVGFLDNEGNDGDDDNDNHDLMMRDDEEKRFSGKESSDVFLSVFRTSETEVSSSRTSECSKRGREMITLWVEQK